jgi:hypothetical protein
MVSQKRMIQLSVYSVGAVLLAWVIAILGDSFANTICSYRLIAAAPADLTMGLIDCLGSTRAWMLLALISLAFTGFLVGIIAFAQGKDKPLLYRLLALLGIAMGLGLFILLGIVWFFRD